MNKLNVNMNTAELNNTQNMSNEPANTEVKLDEPTILTTMGRIPKSTFKLFRNSGMARFSKKVNLKNKSILKLKQLFKRHFLLRDEIRAEAASRAKKSVKAD